jgi:hypothetical protein
MNLYKLKNYYYSIQITKQNQEKNMNDLSFKYRTYTDGVKEVNELGNIDCNNKSINKPFNISILNSKNTKETKFSIQAK